MEKRWRCVPSVDQGRRRQRKDNDIYRPHRAAGVVAMSWKAASRNDVLLLSEHKLRAQHYRGHHQRAYIMLGQSREGAVRTLASPVGPRQEAVQKRSQLVASTLDHPSGYAAPLQEPKDIRGHRRS